MPLARLLAPPVCAACGTWAGALEPLCAACRSRLRWLGPASATPLRARHGTAQAVLLWAPVAYEGPARALVRALKYGGAHAVARAMAAQIAANAPPGLLSGALVPAPALRRRARRRGFDQAALLAARLAERTGLPLAPCLERTGGGPPQVGRGRAARLAGPAGAFAVRAGARAPARAVLVDDVATTGATLGACADALRRAGAREVAAVAYARTPGR